MANRNRVTIVINADGTAAIETFGRVEDAAGRTGEDIEKKTASLTSRIKQHWLGLTAAVTAAYLAASKAWDLAEQAAKYEQSRQAFRGMVTAMGLDAQVEFAKIKQASAGLIDNKVLIEATNRAMSLGIGIERMGDLMQIARAKARDMGTTTTQAFDDIVTGIGRASPMILDNLGLTLKVGEANEAHAKALHKTVEQLTAAEQKQAILNAVLDAGTESLERHNLELLTRAERMQKIQATVENMKLTLGALITRLGVGLMGVFDVEKTVFLGIGAAITAVVGGPFQMLFDVIAKLGGPEITIVYDTFDKQMELIGKSAKSAGENFTAMVASSEELAGGIRKVGGAGAKIEQAMTDAEMMLYAKELYAARELSIEEENARMIAYAKEYYRAQDLQKQRQFMSQGFGMMAGMMQDFYNLSGEKSKSAFKAYKAFSIAQAVVDTYKAAQGAYAALAGIPIVGPALAAAAAAAAIAAGMARVKAIESQQPGGSASISASGGGGAGGYSAPRPEAPEWKPPYSYERDNYGTGWKPGEGQAGYQIVVHGDVYAQDSEEFARKVLGPVQEDLRDFNSDTSRLARRAAGGD